MESVVSNGRELWRGCGGSKQIIVASSIGVLMGAAAAQRAISAMLNARYLRQKCVARREQHLKAKKEFAEKFKGIGITDLQREILGLDIQTLKEKLQEGNLKSADVLEGFQIKAIQVDAKTNAVTEFLEDAMPRAKELDLLPRKSRGPLHGIPISLKEHIQLAGKDCTVGYPSEAGKIMAKDAELVLMLKHLGAVPFCRTNLPQSLLSFECSNPIFGITKNPRDLTRSPGGSSGGEGALIGGGGSIIGFGSDVGGSVRIPAAFCGITSLKPTNGRIPQSGQGSDGGLVGCVGIYNSLGFMSRSAKGIADFVQVVLQKDNLIKYTPVDARFVPLPWDNMRAKPERKLKIGWYDFDGVYEATPGCRRAVQVAVTALQNLGHEVVPFRPPNLTRVQEVYGAFLSADVNHFLRKRLQQGPVSMHSIALIYMTCIWPSWKKKLAGLYCAFKSPILKDAFWSSPPSKSWQLWELCAERLELVEEILRQWGTLEIDVVIAPGFAMPAVPLGYPAYLEFTCNYTEVYNLLNFPAGSLTVTLENEADQLSLESTYPSFEKDLVYGWTKEGAKGATGLPLNVQVIGRPYTEELVLRAMSEVEKGVGDFGLKFE